MQAFNKRDMTGLGLSIGTGLALESLLPDIEVFDRAREFKHIDTTDYDVFYISVFTLIRNMLTSIPTMERNKALKSLKVSSHVYEVLRREMAVIEAIMGRSDMKIIFYTMDYSAYRKKFILRPSDPKSVGSLNTEIYLQTEAIKKLVKRDGVRSGIVEYKKMLPAAKSRQLVLTHSTIDLLSVKNIPRLDLLESHTGRLVEKKGFNKKYFDKDLTFMPWCEDLLGILGDKTLVKPALIGLRKLLIEEAKRLHWTPVTSCTSASSMRGVKLYYRSLKT